jgi:hypothetical protein
LKGHSAKPVLDRAYRYSGSGNRPSGLTLPPDHLPLVHHWTLLKQWRYVGIWTRDICLCAGSVKVGPLALEFWAVWFRANRRYIERTRFLTGRVKLPERRLIVKDGAVSIDIELEEDNGFEVVTPYGQGYIWTRKQLIPARGTVRIGGEVRQVNATAFIDDNAGYHPRRITWKWSGGIGIDTKGREVAWNVIVGYNDVPPNSENTIWIEGVAREVGRVSFAQDLSAITFAEGGSIHFQQEAVRARRDNLLIIRSDYAQPVGVFTGTLPGGIELSEAYGVMERQDALW